MKIEIIPQKKKYEVLLDLYPPVLANRDLPEWYKKAKLGTKDATLMNEVMAFDGTKGAKDCPAIQDYLSTGFYIPLWGDFMFKTYQNNMGGTEQNWEMTSASALGLPKEEFVYYHNTQQLAEMPLNQTMYGQTLKFNLPYKIIVPEGYSILYQDPFYHFRPQLQCLSGVVEADKWGFVSFPFDLKSNDFYLDAGTPLVHCFVYKRDTEKIDLVTRKGTDQEYEDIRREIIKLDISRGNYKENHCN